MLLVLTTLGFPESIDAKVQWAYSQSKTLTSYCDSSPSFSLCGDSHAMHTV